MTCIISRAIRPFFGGWIVVLRTNRVELKKMAIINTVWLVLINRLCIGYMLADYSRMNRPM